MKKPSILSKPVANLWVIIIISLYLTALENFTSLWQIIIMFLLYVIGMTLALNAGDQYKNKEKAELELSIYTKMMDSLDKTIKNFFKK